MSGTAGERLILALNCGSSSLKFGAYRAAEPDPVLLCEGEAEEIGKKNSSFWFTAEDKKQEEQFAIADHAAALKYALDRLRQRQLGRFNAVGHRLVHGGPELREHQLLTPKALQNLRGAILFAPLHLPAALKVIQAVSEQMPGVSQAICLDTAFHRGMPDVAKTFALPKKVRDMGVERYGFHGLSLESIIAQLKSVPERMVVAHLGNGSSITAIRDGQSVDTSMGLTPTGGVMMGTRCGDLDPGVILYLMRNHLGQADELEDIVNRQSGLAGISETSSDVRELLKGRKDTRADLALRMFCYQVGKTIAAMAAALGGLELLIFTGGIGEHAEQLRKEICEPLGFFGDYEARVLPAEEDLQIARITAKLTS